MFHPEGELGVARAAPRPATTCRSSRPSTTAGVEDVTEARGAPIWYQLYATNSWDVAKAHVERAESAGCSGVAVTVDRNGGRNQETLFRLRRARHAQLRRAATTASSLTGRPAAPPMYQGVDISELTQHPVLGA